MRLRSSDPIQVAKQSSGSLQGALALSAAEQMGARTTSRPSGSAAAARRSVKQSNDASSTASADNTNSTTQSADQDSGAHRQRVRMRGRSRDPGAGTEGRERPGRGVGLEDDPGLREEEGVRLQLGRQLRQPGPCLEPGGDGSVDQSNTATSKADRRTANSTSQDAEQASPARESTSRPSPRRPRTGSSRGRSPARSRSTRRTRPAAPGCTAREAAARSTSPTRVLDGGSDNATAPRRTPRASTARARAGAAARPAIQALGQDAGNLQTGFGLSAVLQQAPKSSNGGASVWSPGNDGTTRQSNKASSNGDADNRNGLSQLGMQMQ